MSFTDNLKDRADVVLDRWALEEIEYRVKLVEKEREELKSWSDKELRLSTVAFKQDLKNGKRLDALVVPAFSVVNEVCRRVLGKSPYPVQILAGLIIHSGRVAEMKAGEGKTITETMPVYLNALAGNGVHLITTNDYLAERDAKAMGKVYDFLGMTTGFVTQAMESAQRKQAYACDVTYVTNQEVGFDYLRDNLVYSRSDRVLRPEHPLYFGIVDEVDSILIDESRTPLIIAEPVQEAANYYDIFTKIAGQLREGRDYEVDYKDKRVSMADIGLNRVEEMLGEKVFSENNPMYVFYLDVCLRAKVLFEKDRDYIIDKDGVQIVDEFTGRVLPGRRFTDGVHQAIEAKEGVKVRGADRTQASITFQNFFPMYEKISGMSGTVMRSRDEFNRVYKLDVIQIPTNRPVVRVDHNDLFFKTQKGKFTGLVKKINQIHQKGQPLLIGSRNVETAHAVARLLDDQELPYQLLTAADHKLEAEKIAKAGQPGMITVATNMAGRGTDILLGEGVADLGGLFVLGTERHESRRIDDQLTGRAGRQGDAGESQFLISMEDEIMQLFGSEKIIDAMENYDIPEDEYISGRTLTGSFKKAQDFVESKNLDGRLYLYKYDSITSFQRKTIYELRNRLLDNEPEFARFMEEALGGSVQRIFHLKDAPLIAKKLKEVFQAEVNLKEIGDYLAAGSGKPSPLAEYLDPFYYSDRRARALADLQKRMLEFLKPQLMQVKKDPEVYKACQMLILQQLDNAWGQHLEAMDVLKEEANLFSYASEDPLIDFILDGKKMFERMLADLKENFLKIIFLRLEQKGELK